MFQGLRSLLTMLCKFAQRNVAFISLDHVTLDVVNNVLLNGVDGDRVPTTKLNDLNVTTFHVCSMSVLETVDKHAFWWPTVE